MILTHIVTPDEEGMTLEALLRGPMALSGRQTREAKQGRRVSVDGAAMFANQRVRAGQTVRVELGEYAQGGDVLDGQTCRRQHADGSACGAQGERVEVPGRHSNAPSFPPVRVLYEDDALIAVHKPALLQCHPSPSAPGGSDTLESRVSRHLAAQRIPFTGWMPRRAASCCLRSCRTRRRICSGRCRRARLQRHTGRGSSASRRTGAGRSTRPSPGSRRTALHASCARTASVL